MKERKVFLSHAHADNPLADRYAVALRERGLDVWYDRTNLRNGARLSDSIECELVLRRAFVVLLTPEAIKSSWVKLELDAYRDLVAKDPDRVLLPVRILPCEVPPLLRAQKWVDATVIPFDAAVEEIARAVSGMPPRLTNQPKGGEGGASLACPQCRQIDQIRKVTYIVSSGSPLADRLSPPLHPSYFSASYYPQSVKVSLMFPGVSVVGWFITGVLLLSLGVVGIRFGMNASGLLVAVGWVLGLAGAIPLTHAILAWVYALRDYSRRLNAESSRRNKEWQRRYAAAVAAWGTAMRVWEITYYCARCDVAFVPGSASSIVPPERLQEFLYSTAPAGN